MKSIIKQIFYGNKGHYETIKLTEKYKKMLNKVIIYDEKLRRGLTNKQLHLYQQTNDAIEELHNVSIDNHFVEGFKLGLLIGIECSDI